MSNPRFSLNDTAMRMNPNQRFRSDFIFDHLPALLSRELGCGAFETDQHLAWFSKQWQYIPPQKTQEAFNQAARHEVIHHVGPHRLKVEPKVVVRDQPIESWEKCKHWGGSRECANCKRAADVAGPMRRAEALYQENADFVRWYIKEVALPRRCQTVPDQVVDDMAHAAWHHVVKVIDNFKDPGSGPRRRAWLKSIADQIVHDYFVDSWRDKRDARLEDSYDQKAAQVIAAGG